MEVHEIAGSYFERCAGRGGPEGRGQEKVRPGTGREAGLGHARSKSSPLHQNALMESPRNGPVDYGIKLCVRRV